MSKDPTEEFFDKCPTFLNLLANMPEEEFFKRLDEAFNYKTDLEIKIINKGNSIIEELVKEVPYLGINRQMLDIGTEEFKKEIDKYILEDIKNE